MLVWRDEDGVQKILPLDPDKRYSVGRRPSMAISLPWDTKVSKLHAQLECIDGEWVITDDGLSRNGTRINESLIRERARLRNEDHVRVGDTILEFHASPEDVELPDTDPEEALLWLPQFTPGEHEVLVELCRNWFRRDEADVAPQDVETVPNETIAETLHISVNTVKARLGRCYDKCKFPEGMRDKRTPLMHYVVQRGIVSGRDDK